MVEEPSASSVISNGSGQRCNLEKTFRFGGMTVGKCLDLHILPRFVPLEVEHEVDAGIPDVVRVWKLCIPVS